MIKKFYYIRPLLGWRLWYNGNGNTGGSAPVDPLSPYRYGDFATILGNTSNLTKTNYTFTGWNTAADGTGTSYSAGDTLIANSDTTLYALWLGDSKTIVVLENLLGLTCHGSGTYPYGSQVTISAPTSYTTFYNDVWNFYGWERASEIITGNPKTITVTGNETYNAIYKLSNKEIYYIDTTMLNLGSVFVLNNSFFDSWGSQTINAGVSNWIYDHCSSDYQNITIKFKVTSNSPYTFTIKDPSNNDIAYSFDGEYYVFTWSKLANGWPRITIESTV